MRPEAEEILSERGLRIHQIAEQGPPKWAKESINEARARATSEPGARPTVFPGPALSSPELLFFHFGAGMSTVTDNNNWSKQDHNTYGLFLPPGPHMRIAHRVTCHHEEYTDYSLPVSSVDGHWSFCSSDSLNVQVPRNMQSPLD
jgi:hypothetical protein